MKLRSWIACSVFALVGTLLLALLLSSGSTVRAASLGAIQNVSRDAELSIGPQVAQDPDGNVHVVWTNNEEGRYVRYAKGVWNGSAYDFGPVHQLADAGSFPRVSPSLAVAPNGTIMVAWSDSELKIRAWNSRDSAPGGGIVDLGGFQHFQPTIAADSAGHFHIAWNGGFQVQYCEWDGAGCSKRDAWSNEDEGSGRPDIIVDSNDGVHVVWNGSSQRVMYRARSANAEWGSIQEFARGVTPQIAADSRGSVHIVWSRDFNILYCRKTLSSGCLNGHTIDARAEDISPSVGATLNGNVVVAFQGADDGPKRLFYTAREEGTWSGPQDIADGPTAPDVTPRAYVARASFVWSLNFETHLATVNVAGAPPPTPTPMPTPTPTPIPCPTPGPAQNLPPAGPHDTYLPLVIKTGCS